GHFCLFLQELHGNPHFYSAKAKRLDLCQGLLGDCWFLAALQALTLHQDILSRVIPLNQSFTEKYAGIFRFWFWHFGQWVPVVVDDRLPVNEAGQLVFVSSTYKNLFWGALLEKAYAKLSGSYEDLQRKQVSEALVDFTGGLTMTINLAEAPGNLWDILTRATYSRTRIGCQTHAGVRLGCALAGWPPPCSRPLCQPAAALTSCGPPDSTSSRTQSPDKERALKNGLVHGHAYTLPGIRKVTSKRGPAYLIKLRKPWGRVEWKGDWSDSSSVWELLSPKEKLLLLRKDDDGEFWMALQDFKAHFMLLVICKLSPGLLSQDMGQKWSYTMLEGRWEKGTTAGGPTKSPQDTFWKNPQFLLSVWRPQEGRRFQMPCSMLVSLLQKPRHRHCNKKPHLAIGFYLFRVGGPLSYDDQRRLPPKFFWKNAPLNWPETFLREKEVSRELWLEPGTYVIVPYTSESRQESEFVLRVVCRKHVFYEIGRNSSVVFSKETVDQSEGQDEFFTKLFEKHPEINAVQLQKILNHMPWSGLRSEQPLFSLETCQGILALLDVSFWLNASGTVSIQEFRDPWKQLMLYQVRTSVHHVSHGMVQKWQFCKTIRQPGLLVELTLSSPAALTLGCEGLSGIVLSDDVCRLMLIRYGGPDLQMDVVSFVRLMLRVENMEDVFQNLTQDGKGIYLQKPEILKAIRGGLQGVAANLLEFHSGVFSDPTGNFTVIIFIITTSASPFLCNWPGEWFPQRFPPM
ncbi:hypothetical protein E2I00_020117, partial [Balaenoptera physalus]